MKADLQYIKSQAQELIETYALTIPVHIFELADLMGIKWKTSTTEQLKKFMLQKNPDVEKVINNWDDVLGFSNDEIILNDDNNPITRKRFTMAHEIGHVKLHHNTNNLQRKIFLRQDIFVPRDDLEAEANYFAGYLLMPDKTISERLKYTEVLPAGETLIRSFAKTFAVSPDAMRIRFKTFKTEYPELWKRYQLDEKIF